jgi:zinc transport system permease protein
MEFFQYEFLRNALYAIVLASLICGIAGSLIVVNQMVFLSGAVAHSAYGGVGLAFYLNYKVLPTTLVFSALTSTLLGFYTADKTHRIDSIIGIFWAFGMAFGIILIDLTPGYRADILSYLFGSILTVTFEDILIIATLDIVAILFVILFYKKIVLFSFDREFAYAKGVNIKIFHTAIVVLSSLSIVVLIKVVGLILVIAMLTIPQYLSEKKCNNLIQMMIFSSLYALLFFVFGLILSYNFNISSGASIILIASIWFVLENLVYKLFKKKL